jgi:hypothetical protein
MNDALGRETGPFNQVVQRFASPLVAHDRLEIAASSQSRHKELMDPAVDRYLGQELNVLQGKTP